MTKCKRITFANNNADDENSNVACNKTDCSPFGSNIFSFAVFGAQIFGVLFRPSNHFSVFLSHLFQIAVENYRIIRVVFNFRQLNRKSDLLCRKIHVLLCYNGHTKYGGKNRDKNRSYWAARAKRKTCGK